MRRQKILAGLLAVFVLGSLAGCAASAPLQSEQTADAPSSAALPPGDGALPALPTERIAALARAARAEARIAAAPVATQSADLVTETGFPLPYTPPAEPSAAAPSDEAAAYQPFRPAAADGDFDTAYAARLREAINALRAENGVAALLADEKLAAAVRLRAEELVRYGYFAHTRFDGSGWQTVFARELPLQYVSAGENLGQISISRRELDTMVTALMDDWCTSPLHYENLVRGLYPPWRGGL